MKEEKLTAMVQLTKTAETSKKKQRKMKRLWRTIVCLTSAGLPLSLTAEGTEGIYFRQSNDSISSIDFTNPLLIDDSYRI
jgi:hypothetical protein